MFSVITPSLIVAAALTNTIGRGDGTYSSRAFGKMYTSHVDEHLVAKTPKWNDREADPPLSPRQALKLADKMLRSIAKAPDGWKWKAWQVRLSLGVEERQQNSGVWDVTYLAIPVDHDGGPIPYHAITLTVLMDGTVIKPTVTDIKRGEKEVEYAEEESD